MRENLHWFTDSAGTEGNGSDKKFGRPHWGDVVRCLVSGKSRTHHTFPCRKHGTRLDSHHKLLSVWPSCCSGADTAWVLGAQGPGLTAVTSYDLSDHLAAQEQTPHGYLGHRDQAWQPSQAMICLTILLLRSRHHMGTWGTGTRVCLSVPGPEQEEGKATVPE